MDLHPGPLCADPPSPPPSYSGWSLLLPVLLSADPPPGPSPRTFIFPPRPPPTPRFPNGRPPPPPGVRVPSVRPSPNPHLASRPWGLPSPSGLLCAEPPLPAPWVPSAGDLSPWGSPPRGAIPSPRAPPRSPRGSLLPPLTLPPRPADPTPHPRPRSPRPTPFGSLASSPAGPHLPRAPCCCEPPAPRWLSILSCSPSVSRSRPLGPAPHPISPAPSPSLLGDNFLAGPGVGDTCLPVSPGGPGSALVHLISPGPLGTRDPEPRECLTWPGPSHRTPLPPRPGRVLRLLASVSGGASPSAPWLPPPAGCFICICLIFSPLGVGRGMFLLVTCKELLWGRKRWTFELGKRPGAISAGDSPGRPALQRVRVRAGKRSGGKPGLFIYLPCLPPFTSHFRIKGRLSGILASSPPCAINSQFSERSRAEQRLTSNRFQNECQHPGQLGGTRNCFNKKFLGRESDPAGVRKATWMLGCWMNEALQKESLGGSEPAYTHCQFRRRAVFTG